MTGIQEFAPSTSVRSARHVLASRAAAARIDALDASGVLPDVFEQVLLELQCQGGDAAATELLSAVLDGHVMTWQGLAEWRLTRHAQHTGDVL